MNLAHAFISVGIGFVITFVLTWILGFEETVPVKSVKKEAAELVRKVEIASPAEGQLIGLGQVKDETLASRHSGQGRCGGSGERLGGLSCQREGALRIPHPSCSRDCG